MSTGSALLLAAAHVAGAVILALLLFRAISPRTSDVTPLSKARRWSAWVVAASTVTMFPRVLNRGFDIDPIALWLLAAIALGGAAFAVGYLSGRRRTKSHGSALEASRELNLEKHAMKPPSEPLADNSLTLMEQSLEMDLIYESIALELESGNVQKGLWTKLYAESAGDETMTKVAYIRERASKMQSARSTMGGPAQSTGTSLSPQSPQRPENNPRLDLELADAVWSGNWDTANALLAAGRPAMGVDKNGMSLIDLAAERGDRLMLELLERHFNSLKSPELE